MTDISHVTWVNSCDMGDGASPRATLVVTNWLFAGLLTLLIVIFSVISRLKV